jgi:hypothetical protein
MSLPRLSLAFHVSCQLSAQIEGKEEETVRVCLWKFILRQAKEKKVNSGGDGRKKVQSVGR